MFVVCYKFGGLKRKFSLAPRKMASQQTGTAFSFYTFITGRTTTNFTDYIKFRVPVHLMMGVMCRQFSRERPLNNCNILFPPTGVAPEGDIFSAINLPENSSLIQRFTATLSDAAADAERAKKMYVESLAPGTVKTIVLFRYTSRVCATTTPPPSVSHQPAFIPTDKVHI